MSTKTVAEKLSIKSDSLVWTSDPDRLDLLGALPDGARTVTGLAAASVAILLADDAASLGALLANHGADDGDVGSIALDMERPAASSIRDRRSS